MATTVTILDAATSRLFHRETVAAAFIPGGGGMLPAHVVVYPDHKGTFTVHYLVHSDSGPAYLHQGSYDLSYRDAVAELQRRVALNLRTA